MAELRMRDLCARTGLSRQAIHFYVAQGLVDAPEKTGKTMGYYTEAHVERILLVRRLKEEHFLPLRAIRALLAHPREGHPLAAFTPAQRDLLAGVKARLSPATTGTPGGDRDVEVGALLAQTGVTHEDLAELERLGLVEVRRRGRRRVLGSEDAWIVELWSRVRAAGFTAALGFEPDLLVAFEEGVSRIFEDEKRILARLAADLPANRVAELVERGLPLVHAFLVRAHERKVRELFSAFGGSS